MVLGYPELSGNPNKCVAIPMKPEFIHGILALPPSGMIIVSSLIQFNFRQKFGCRFKRYACLFRVKLS